MVRQIWRNVWAVMLAVWLGSVPVQAGKLPVYRGPDLPVKPPLPIWPSDWETITQRAPVFRLNGRFEATCYRVELARDADFKDPVLLDSFEVTDRSGIAPVVLVGYKGQPLQDGEYYWRAFAGDGQTFWTPPANYRKFFVSRQDRDAVAPPAESIHPRLIISADEVDALKERIACSSHLARGWAYQLNAAYSSLELEPPDERYAAAGRGQHGSYSTAASWYHRHLENVAFVALMTGDKRLAKKGVEMLMTACRYERWLGPLFDKPDHFDPPWMSALETAMMTSAVATGYDLLYHHLTEQQREMVRTAMAEKGIRHLIHDWVDPIGSSQLPRHQIPSGNWVMVCGASAGTGALAMLGEHPDAPRWCRLVRNRVRAWFEDRGNEWFVDNPNPRNRPDPIPVLGPSDGNFGVDGGYKETIGYMNYGTRYACSFADSLRRITGENLFVHVPENLLNQMAWSMMAWPVDEGVKSRFIDFGDEGGSPVWFADLLAVLMKNRRDPLAAWLYRRTSSVPISVRSLVWYDDALGERAPETSVPMGVFRTVGHVIMRNGWSPETPMAAIKFFQNRGHHDIGQCFLFGGGHPTLVDSGSADYGSKVYGQYLCQSVAHNLVLVDNLSQQRTDGEMLAAVGTPGLQAASGELRAAYPDQIKSWTRDLLMLPACRTALVFDHLEGKGPHQYDLVLHPYHPFEMIGESELHIGDARSSTIVNVYGRHPFGAFKQDGYIKLVPQKYVRFNSKERASEASFMTLCQWPAEGQMSQVAPQVSRVGPGAWFLNWDIPGMKMGVSLGGVGSEWIESDARVAAAWCPEGMNASYLMLGGRRLRVDGKDVLRSTAPLHVSLERGSNSAGLRGHIWSSVASRLTICEIPESGDSPGVFLNDKPVAVEVGEGGVSLNVPIGEWQLEVTRSEAPSRRSPNWSASDLLAISGPGLDAPAFHRGIRTRTSSTWSDGIDVLDGDPNTHWVSLPGLPMPQWLEIVLTRPEAMQSMSLVSDQPMEGRLEYWDDGTATWALLGRFQTTPDRTSETIRFERVKVNRFRAVVEQVSQSGGAAVISTLTWSDAE